MSPAPEHAPRYAHRAGFLFVAAVLAWLTCGFWNFIKPLPFGTRVTSLPARLAESQVDFIEDEPQHQTTLHRELALVDRAEQMVVIDQCPIGGEMAAHLLARKRQHPNLKVVVVTDPRNEVYGGTPARRLSTLEYSGIIVARVRLERLRDSNPWYSSLWRLGVAWWEDPYSEIPGEITLRSTLRNLNFKSDRRRLLVADDGAGGWGSIVASGSGTESADTVALEVRGQLARAIAGSELQIAAWSTEDDRLPSPPPLENRGVGSIDARFVTESGIRAALRDAIALAAGGDSIDIAVHEIGDRRIVDALLRAAARGARLQVLLDPKPPANQAVARELRMKGGRIDVRWRTTRPAGGRFVLIRHGNDVWLTVGSADLTRRSLDDLNLEAAIELRMPARAAIVRAAAGAFAASWSSAAAYAAHADESDGVYWRYRIEELTGLRMD